MKLRDQLIKALNRKQLYKFVKKNPKLILNRKGNSMKAFDRYLTMVTKGAYNPDVKPFEEYTSLMRDKAWLDQMAMEIDLNYGPTISGATMRNYMDKKFFSEAA